jgi:hypothetical protein
MVAKTPKNIRLASWGVADARQFKVNGSAACISHVTLQASSNKAQFSIAIENKPKSFGFYLMQENR